MRREFSEPSSARLALAVMWAPDFVVNWDEVAATFGPLGQRGPDFEFQYTSYYTPEMGSGLKKCFVEVQTDIARERLPEFKHRGAELETRHLRPNAEGKRVRALNIDPLIVTLENVVVSTSKNFPHRIYLGQGVFADLALIRRRTGFEGLPWTYKDYLDQLPFFEKIHASLKRS